MAEPYEVADTVARQFVKAYEEHDVSAVEKMIHDVGSCGWESLLEKSRVPAVPDFSEPGKEKLTVMNPVYAGGNPFFPIVQYIPMVTAELDTVCPAKADVTPPKRFVQPTAPLPGLDHNGL